MFLVSLSTFPEKVIKISAHNFLSGLANKQTNKHWQAEQHLDATKFIPGGPLFKKYRIRYQILVCMTMLFCKMLFYWSIGSRPQEVPFILIFV